MKKIAYEEGDGRPLTLSDVYIGVMTMYPQCLKTTRFAPTAPLIVPETFMSGGLPCLHASFAETYYSIPTFYTSIA